MVQIIVAKFLLIFLMSFLFGIERQISKKPVGFGTYIFVSVGSCALGIAALSISLENPLPLLSAIVTGIGFLGAGALIKSTDKIFGFTSAASIWIFSIIGLLIGIGEYLVGLLTYAIVWIVILVDRYLETKNIGNQFQRKITIKMKGNFERSKILAMLDCKKHWLVHFSNDKKKKISTIKYIVPVTNGLLDKITKKLSEKKEVISFEIE